MSYERVTRFDSPNYTPELRVAEVFGLPRVVTSITIHHWGNAANKPTLPGVVNWLCRPNGNSSAHAVIEAGQVVYIVDYNNASWHAGNAAGNATSIGLELNPRAWDADYETAGEHIADIWMSYGLLPLKPHNAWTATECPGQWDLNRLSEVASRYYATKKSARDEKHPELSVPSFHFVVKGDTLYGIARKYHISYPQLLAYNGGKLPSVIHPGEKYRIKKG